jgi:hypothetical protein
MTRWQNRLANRGSPDQFGRTEATAGASLTWFGGGNSAEDSSGNPGDAARPADNERFDLLQQRFLDSFQVG